MAAVHAAMTAGDFSRDRRPSFQPLLYESLDAVSFLDLAFDSNRRSSIISLSGIDKDDVKTALGMGGVDMGVDEMFEAMFPIAKKDAADMDVELDEDIDVESILGSDSFGSEGTMRVSETPMFPPISSFHSITIPTTIPAANPLISPAVVSAAAAVKRKPKRPRAGSAPQQPAKPSRPIARGSSLPQQVAVAVPVPAESPVDFLDALTRSSLGPDPALLEDASLDAIEDAIYEGKEGEDGDKKGKKRRRRTTAELTANELETRRLKNSEAARRCRLRKTLRVKWLEARVKELEEMNAMLVAKLREKA